MILVYVVFGFLFKEAITYVMYLYISYGANVMEIFYV